MHDTDPTILERRVAFGQAVRMRRKKLGFTQLELSARAELHRTYIADVERGARNLSLESMEKLAGALNTSVAGLLGGGGKGPVQRTGSGEAIDSGKQVEILLIEDNPDDVELTLRAFRAARLMNRVHTVKDGEAAIEFLFPANGQTAAWAPPRPLLVLLDLNLPGLSGLEVLRQIRSDPRTAQLPVVVLTVSKDSQDMAECRQLGCRDYLIKPVDFDNFSKITPELRLDWTLIQHT